MTGAARLSNLQAAVDWTVRIANGALVRRASGWADRHRPCRQRYARDARTWTPHGTGNSKDVRGKLGVPVEKAYNRVAMRTILTRIANTRGLPA